MARMTKDLLRSVSAAELKQALAVKSKVEELEARRATLTRDLAKIEKEIAKLMDGGTAPARKKATRKKAAKKKVAKKAAKKTAKKTVRKKAGVKKAGVKKAGVKKAGRKKVAAKAATRKTTRKTTKKTTRKSAGKTPRVKAPTGARLEDVIIQVIKAGGGRMAFPEIKETITSQKLYKTKSKNFDNVLRRTISTAKGVKRVARGVYSA